MNARGGLSGVAAAAMTAMLLAVPGSASATTTCDYSSAGKLLTIDMPADWDGARIERSGNEIVVRNGSLITIACTGGTPTVTNTDAISAFNQPGGERNIFGIAGPGSFAPGGTPEAGDDEIEIFVNLNDSENGSVPIHGGSDTGGQSVRFGKGGINLNATPGEVQPDADVVLNGVPSVSAAGGPGPDSLGAQGGAGTGSALTDGIRLAGLEGADVLTGGEGDDELHGWEGTNTLLGMGGADTLLSGPGDDAIDGGAGQDMARFTDPEGASVDLGITGPQDTGAGVDVLAGIEDLGGAEGPDVLRGDGGPNTLAGSEGNDVLEGRAGNDTLLGDTGNDVFEVRDGGPDTADCAEGSDTVTADELGIDILTGCESVIFPAPPGPGGGDPPAFGSSARVTLALAARRIRAERPLRIRVENANDFAVSGRLSARTSRPGGNRAIGLSAHAFTVGGRAKTNVSLELPARARKLLKRKGRLPLRLTAAITDPANNTRVVRKRVSPSLKPPRGG